MTVPALKLACAITNTLVGPAHRSVLGPDGRALLENGEPEAAVIALKYGAARNVLVVKLTPAASSDAADDTVK